MLKLWQECTAPELREANFAEDIAAVVVSSCEQHARHLPTGTDAVIGRYILEEAAKQSRRTVYLMPGVEYGFSHHHLSLGGTLSLNQKTLAAVAEDLMGCAHLAGFRNLVVLNSHGGNMPALQLALNELGAGRGIRSVLVRYWDFLGEFIRDWRQTGPGGIGHAGEMETSMMLHIRPDLVRTGEIEGYQPAQGNQWFHPDMFAPNRVSMYNPFEQYSPHGNVGVADTASGEKGKQVLEFVTQQLAAFLDDFWTSKPWLV